MDTTPHRTASRPLGPSEIVLARVDAAWPPRGAVSDVRLHPRDRRETADLGEALARRHLERAGHVVLASNWRPPDGRPRGEVDLVTRDPEGRLVVVEVKARRGQRQGRPQEAVTHDKRSRLRALALAWLRDARRRGVPRCRGLRFDVIAVRFHPDGRVELCHTSGAF